MSNPKWFVTKKISSDLYLTREVHFFEGNRSNIWLIKGPGKDVIIDCGLGVCDLRQHLENEGLIEPPGGERPCQVICTHVHFDHCGGAHHFDDVYIHEDDLLGLQHGRQTETLNYVKPAHFYESPYRGFSACKYKVPPTPCNPLRHGDMVELGGGHHLEILHVPGHTKGSIAVYYEQRQALFSGDFIYNTGSGGALLDWLPSSCVRDYIKSAENTLDWLTDHDLVTLYPGHFGVMGSERTGELLQQYIEARQSCCTRGCMSCLQAATFSMFLFGCFRCCPC